MKKYPILLIPKRLILIVSGNIIQLVRVDPVVFSKMYWNTTPIIPNSVMKHTTRIDIGTLPKCNADNKDKWKGRSGRSGKSKSGIRLSKIPSKYENKVEKIPIAIKDKRISMSAKTNKICIEII